MLFKILMRFIKGNDFTSNQSGVGLIYSLVVGAGVISGVYFLSDKINIATKRVAVLQKVELSSFSMKSVVAYAKDLVASRVCLDAAQLSGIPTATCKLTDTGSLERLIISNSVSKSLCMYYNNSNPKLQDGLQNFCEPGKPPLNLATYSFTIIASKVTAQHPLYNLFNVSSGYSLGAQCIKVTYKSTISNLHATFATIETTAQAYKDVTCSTDLLSQAGSTDIIFPRPLNGYVLISNRSISVGNVSVNNAATTVNVFGETENIIFNSPVFINQNLYLPEIGTAISKKVLFNDKVFLAGSLLSTTNTVLKPVPGANGNLWVGLNPNYSGIAKGIHRNDPENSLTRMLSADLSPVNNGLLMEECKDYRNRKLGKDYCDIEKPRLVAKLLTASSYLFGMSKLGEFVPKDISGNASKGVTYKGTNKKNPKTAQMSFTHKSDSDTRTYLAREDEATIDLMQFEILKLANEKECITIENPPRRICFTDDELNIWTVGTLKSTDTDLNVPNGTNSGKFFVQQSNNKIDVILYEKITYEPRSVTTNTPATTTTTPGTTTTTTATAAGGGNAATTTTTTTIAANNATVGTTTTTSNTTPTVTTTIVTTASTVTTTAATSTTSTVYDEKTEIFYTVKALLVGPKLIFKTKSRYTPAGDIAQQVLQVDIELSATIDTQIFKIPINNTLLEFLPYDFCQESLVYQVNVKLFQSKVEFNTALVNSISWTDLSGNQKTFSQKELDYLDGKPLGTLNSYNILCSNVAAPTAAFASYDADWSAEAFNTWNYAPINKTEMYRPGANQTAEYNKLFDISIVAKSRLTLLFNSQNTFYSSAINDQCVVHPDTTIVKGFFVCRYLHISARVKDLEMIGTFIVDKLKIDSLNGKKITWSNIYHPNVRERLEHTDPNHGIKKINDCHATLQEPAWARISNICDPSYLVMKSDPHSWTTIDPLCVIITGNPVAICKPPTRAYNLEMIKIYDYFGK